MSDPTPPADDDDDVFWQAVRDGYSYEAAKAKQHRADSDH